MRSPGPPLPVPFVPAAAPSSPTWDDYLTSGANNSFELSFPANMNFGGTSVSRETRQAPMPSTSNGSSSSYSAPSYLAPSQRRLSPAPLKVTPTSQERQASSSLPSPVSYSLLSTVTPHSSSAMTFPLSVIRPGMKPVEMKTVMMKTEPATPDTPSGTQVGRWTKREHELFLEGLQRFGKSWKKISSLVHTRTLVQIRTHAQKYLQKQSRAAIKADAKAAEAALRQSQTRPKTPQQQQFRPERGYMQPHQLRVATTGPPTLEIDNQQTSTLTPRHWKSPRAEDRFVPLAFPSALSASTSKTSSATSPRSAFQINSVSRLDQLLQDDNGTVPAFVDEYYTSPTAIEDDLLRPLYTDEQWVPRLTHPGASANYSTKRRRLEYSTPACTSAPTIAAPTLRPAFPNSVFEPLPAPDNLSSPSTSPSAYAQRQSAVLLAAHENDETTNYTNAWL
ncbi:unnamed protein product [Phytophthora lilii]|uniref:Unnamed protein product n=1 Tax=Phytophthora lilii TaxID=2077276 RepID=A0A9W6X1R3_9STRA|nr:unnamed protein product [Phytophthora lilii]